MNILFLDDDPDALEDLNEWIHVYYKGEIQTTLVSNLIDFDYELYESGTRYDKYILDLGIIKPVEFTDDEYKQWLDDVGISKITWLNTRISVLGWDYYNQVMRVRPSTKDRLDRVMLKTGFAELLVSTLGKDCFLPATLLNKGDEDHNSKLIEFLQKE